MEFVKAKTILAKVRDGSDWYGVDYNMNLYRGCCHGCIYCDSRSNCYHIENFDVPRGKENELEILEAELKKRKDKGVVGIGSMFSLSSINANIIRVIIPKTVIKIRLWRSH